jgi:hypothetical protein
MRDERMTRYTGCYFTLDSIPENTMRGLEDISMETGMDDLSDVLAYLVAFHQAGDTARTKWRGED